jgi:hypothetical protein
MKKYLTLLITAAPLLSNCKSEDTIPQIDFGPNGGITVRDNFNRLQGANDHTDWTLDATWNQQEQDLFKDLGVELNGSVTGTLSSISAYPNPVGAGKTVLQLESPTAVTCSFVVVNASYQEVLPLYTAPAANQMWAVSLDVSGANFQQGNLYRIYYVLRNGSTLYYKGHGDIKIGQ